MKFPRAEFAAKLTGIRRRASVPQDPDTFKALA
jgi:hypothetical protein